MVPYGIVSMFFMATMPEEEKARLIEHFETRNDGEKESIDIDDLEMKINSCGAAGVCRC